MLCTCTVVHSNLKVLMLRSVDDYYRSTYSIFGPQLYPLFSRFKKQLMCPKFFYKVEFRVMALHVLWLEQCLSLNRLDNRFIFFILQSIQAVCDNVLGLLIRAARPLQCDHNKHITCMWTLTSFISKLISHLWLKSCCVVCFYWVSKLVKHTFTTIFNH